MFKPSPPGNEGKAGDAGSIPVGFIRHPENNAWICYSDGSNELYWPGDEIEETTRTYYINQVNKVVIQECVTPLSSAERVRSCEPLGASSAKRSGASIATSERAPSTQEEGKEALKQLKLFEPPEH